MGSLTGSVTLRWPKNTETDLAGYKVYYGVSPSVYSVVVNVNLTSTPNNPQYIVTNLSNAVTYYFAVSAYDALNNEAPLSDEVAQSINLPYFTFNMG